MAVVLAFVPYLLIRGPVGRIVSMLAGNLIAILEILRCRNCIAP